MTSHLRSRFSVSRLSVVGAFVLFGLATAGASAAPPLADNGGSGSTSAETSMMIEELGLVPTNGGPDSFSMNQTPVLVGSGPEREIVAVGGPTLVGSGEEREIVANSDAQETAGTLDESARSAALIVLSPEPATVEIVVVNRGQAF